MDYSKELIIDCLNKLDGLSDDSWEDILDRHQLEISPSHLRKMAYGFRAYRNAFGISESDPEFTEKMLKLRCEKQKVTDLKTLTNKKIRELSRAESMIELMSENIDSLSESKYFLSEYIPKENSSGKDMIALLSDVHLGLEFKHCANEYSLEICAKRVNHYMDRIIEYAKFHDVDKVNLVCLGDLMSGEIHNTLRLQNRIDLADQTVEVAELLSECINKLAQNLNYVTVTMCNGNHERIYEKDNNLAKNNYSKIVKHFVKKRCKDLGNVAFLDNTFNDDEICHLNIHGYNFLGCHGDKLNKNKATEELRNVVGIDPNYILIGHYHTPGEFTTFNVKLYQNGSVVGSDEYSITKKLITAPQQKILIVTDEGVICTYDVLVDI